MRLIIDARASNALFADPPSVDLLTSEGLSRIEVDSSLSISDSIQLAAEELGMAVGIGDVKDCFHRLIIPMELARYFCFEGGKAGELGVEGLTIEGQYLHYDSIIYPCPKTLSMGFSWALYLCQCATSSKLSKNVDSSLFRPISDRSAPLVLGMRYVGRVGGYYVYVDNLGFISLCRASVVSALETAVF